MKHSNQLMKGLILSLTAATTLCLAVFTSCSKDKEAPEIEVSGVAVSPSSLNLTEGQSANLTASVSPSNANDKTVTWSSSNTSVATVNGGTVTAVKAGSATITAKAGGKSATVSVTVNPAFIAVSVISFNKTTMELTVGGSETLVATVNPENATDKSITWTSDNPSIASVDGTGKVTGVKAGTAKITAKAGDKTAVCTVTVTAATVHVTGVTLNSSSIAVSVGYSATLIATVSPDNASNKSVKWSSSDASVATVDSEGKVTGIKAGKATITVTTVDGSKTATCKVTVIASTVHVTGVTLNSSSIAVSEGYSATLIATVSPDNASDKSVKWSSSDASVATVDSDGKVTGIKAGKATITVTTVDGSKTATCKVTVTSSAVHPTGVNISPSYVTLRVNETYQMKATVLPDNATDKRVNWFTEDGKVVTINSDGLATAIGVGETRVYVKTADGGYPDYCTVVVKLKGEGTPRNPYLIGSKEELASIDRITTSSYYKVTKDFSVNSSFTPIGKDKPFSGAIDGDGHTISGLALNDANADYLALFAKTSKATISHLSVNGSITGHDDIGGLVGLSSSTVIYDCTNLAAVKGNEDVGGIVGKMLDKTYLISCHNNVDVTGTNVHIGGLVGGMENSFIFCCYARSNVTGKKMVGGLVGFADLTEENATSTIHGCYTYGNITAQDGYAGGIAGHVFWKNIKIQYCYSADLKGSPAITGLGKTQNCSKLSNIDMLGSKLLNYLNDSAASFNSDYPNLPQAWQWIKSGMLPYFNVGTYASK